MYEKDITKNTTIYISRFSLGNFGLGFHFYRIYDFETDRHMTNVLQFGLLFCNITLNFWKDDLARWKSEWK